VRSLVGNTTGVTNPKVATVAAAPVQPPAPAPAKPITPPPAPAPAKVEPKPVIKEAAKPETEIKPDPKAERKAELKQEAEAKREAKAKANAAENAEAEQILSAVNGWAKAWSARDVKGYLNAYAGDFDLPAGQSRKAWSEERRARIEDKGRISVKIESPQISINGNSATVRFRQIYDSDRTKANSRKTLVMTKQSGKWHIKQERSGS
jgi:ketosteroid isomerase-like protein